MGHARMNVPLFFFFGSFFSHHIEPYLSLIKPQVRRSCRLKALHPPADRRIRIGSTGSALRFFSLRADRLLLASLSGPRVGPGPLAPDRQSSSMSKAAIAADV